MKFHILSSHEITLEETLGTLTIARCYSATWQVQLPATFFMFYKSGKKPEGIAVCCTILVVKQTEGKRENTFSFNKVI